MAFTLFKALLVVAIIAFYASASAIPPNVDPDFWKAVMASSATYDPTLGKTKIINGSEIYISPDDKPDFLDTLGETGQRIKKRDIFDPVFTFGSCFDWPGGSPGSKLNPYLNNFLNCVQDLKNKDKGDWTNLGPKGEWHYNYGTVAIVVRNQDSCDGHEFKMEWLWNKFMSKVWSSCPYNAQGWAAEKNRDSGGSGPLVFTIREEYTPLPKATYNC
jgi:hypothetical protein